MLRKIKHFNWFKMPCYNMCLGREVWLWSFFLPSTIFNKRYLSFQKELQCLTHSVGKRILAWITLLWLLCSYISIKIINIDLNTLGPNECKIDKNGFPKTHINLDLPIQDHSFLGGDSRDELFWSKFLKNHQILLFKNFLHVHEFYFAARFIPWRQLSLNPLPLLHQHLDSPSPTSTASPPSPQWQPPHPIHQHSYPLIFPQTTVSCPVQFNLWASH